MDTIHEWIPSSRLKTTVEIWGDVQGNIDFIGFNRGIKPWRGPYRLPVAGEISEYLGGERTSFSHLERVKDRIERVPGQFRQMALLRAMEIPYGETMAYSELADSLDSRAWRAVGSAMANNPVPIIVPCHRVVAKHGIGGFGGDVDLKRALLELEGADVP
jgi:methylated-DNA-[protein]-cysteine S-methyltransferase